jgi:leucyl-tRNA synthetase
MLLNHIFFRRTEKGGIDYFAPGDVDVESDAEGRIVGAKAKADGQGVQYGGIGTMSKSKRNGVDPQQLIAKFGADTARLFVMFAGPPEDTALWSDTGIEGAHRFLRRLWTYAHAGADTVRGNAGAAAWGDAAASVKTARREIHVTLKQATYDYERIQYNTVVSAGMKMLNALEAVPADAAGRAALLREGLSILLRTLYPVVPHIGCALWDDLGYAQEFGPLLDAPWPQVDAAALVQDEIELMLQINGKLRGKLRVPAGADAGSIEAAARASAEVAKHAGSAPVKKVIVVPGRLVNVVV